MDELNQIVKFLEKVEVKNLQDSQDVKKWAKQISSPEFGLIDSCADLLIEELKNPAITKNIINVIRKIYSYEPEIVKAQLQKNNNFSEALVIYIKKTNPEKISQEAIFLLDIIFAEYNYPEGFYSEDFVSALFHLFGNIKSEEIMTSIIKILVVMHFNEVYCKIMNKSPSEFVHSSLHDSDEHIIESFTELMKRKSALEINKDHRIEGSKHDGNHFHIFDDLKSKVLDYYIEKESNHSKLFLEFLLRLLLTNIVTKEERLFTMLLIFDLMNSTCSSLFFLSDLEAFVDYIIMKIEKTEVEIIREYLLKVLWRVVYYPTYSKSNYRKSYLTELMDSCVDSDEVSDSHKEICTEIMNILNSK